MDPRVPRSFGSGIALAGAFTIGWVLHEVFVRGSFAITSPAAVIGTVVGVVLVLVGGRLKRRFDPGTLVPESDAEEDETFDESLSPIEEEWLDGHERDEPRDR